MIDWDHTCQGSTDLSCCKSIISLPSYSLHAAYSFRTPPVILHHYHIIMEIRPLVWVLSCMLLVAMATGGRSTRACHSLSPPYTEMRTRYKHEPFFGNDTWLAEHALELRQGLSSHRFGFIIGAHRSGAYMERDQSPGMSFEGHSYCAMPIY